MCNCEKIEYLKEKLKQREKEKEIELMRHKDGRMDGYIDREIKQINQYLEALRPCKGECEYKVRAAAEAAKIKAEEERKKGIENKQEALKKSIEELLEAHCKLVKTQHASVMQIKNNSDAIGKILSEFELIKEELL